MKHTLKRLARIVASSARRETPVPPSSATGTAPLSSSHNPAYLSAISIKGGRQPFENLGPAQDYVGGDVHTDLAAAIPPDAIGAFLTRDTYPLPATADRENYHGDRHYDWWLSGLKDFVLIQKRLEQQGVPLTAGDSVFEMGCASGRVLRHFAIQRPDLHCWGADINLRHVEWLRLFLPTHLRIFQNTILPHLPIEDNSLTLVTAFSVFTHIDDLDLAWIAELRRIIKPGGFLYLTIHSERTWQEMKPGVPIYDALVRMSAHIPDYHVSETFLQGPLPKDKTVLYWDVAQNYNSNVFHHTDYVRREWGRFFDVADIIPCGSGYQDVVLLRKPG